MALNIPVYPPNVPTTNTIKTAERGQVNYIFVNLQAVTATNTGSLYGNALSAPVAPAVTSTSFGPIVYGIPASKAHEAFAQDFMVQVDSFAATASASPAATVVVMGSLDGVQFYKMATVSVATVGTIFSLAAAAGAQVTNTGTSTPGVKVRYLTASVTAYGGNGGVADAVSAGFIF